jgi:hypothetical protein
MARAPRLQQYVRQAIAEEAAHALAALHRDALAVEGRTRTALHESLPIWLIGNREFAKLRSGKLQGREDIRDYMRKTSAWLHLLYRDGTPYGYVHGKERRKGSHKVTNVSVTREAALIQQAIDEIDRAAADTARAGICECPKVGLAGVIALPKRIKEEPLICVFRDPEARGNWSPGEPVTARAFMERLRRLHIVIGPAAARTVQRSRENES